MPPTTRPPSYTLYVPEASFRAFAILIAAEINGVEITVNTKDAVSAGMSLSKTGKLPVLSWQPMEEGDGLKQQQQAISSSASIARFIASLRTDTKLLGGGSLVQRAEIDAWVDWSLTELELPATIWFYPVVQYMPFHENSYRKAKQDLATALAVLEKTLTTTTVGHDSASGRRYLIGSHLSLADIVIVSTLLYPFKFVCDEEYRSPFPTVTAWFQRCVQLDAFAQVVGVVPLCSTELRAK
jgi:elongation factor 1-gamma